MARIPIIYTWRLKLRPFIPADAPAVQRLAADEDIAAGIPCIPHPYPEGAAATWIATHAQKARADSALVFAITLRDSDELLGAIELGLHRPNASASLGYWIGKPHWRNGYATEAARAVVRFAFSHLALHRVAAQHLAGNPASGRVMQKVGMTREGVRRQAVRIADNFVDSIEYGIVKGELPPSAQTASFTCVYVEPQAQVPALV